jgi:mRNA interferase MazF
VPVGVDEGLKHESALHCDELISLPKAALTDFLGTLSSARLHELELALIASLGIEVGTSSRRK